MCAACGLSASRPLAAIVTVIWLPLTSTMAVPLPLTPLPATGLRLALTKPSAAKAGPTLRARAAAATKPAPAIRVVVVRICFLLDEEMNRPFLLCFRRGSSSTVSAQGFGAAGQTGLPFHRNCSRRRVSAVGLLRRGSPPLEAQSGDLGDQLQGHRTVPLEPHGVLGASVGADGLLEVRVTRRDGVEPDVVLPAGVVDERLAVDGEGRHAVADLLAGVGRRLPDRAPDARKLGPRLLGVGVDVVIDGRKSRGQSWSSPSSGPVVGGLTRLYWADGTTAKQVRNR